MRLDLKTASPPQTVAVVRLVAELAAAAGLPAYLVGGPVRDLLLQRPVADLDFAVEGEVGPLAEALAARVGGSVTSHHPFGTATVTWDSPLHVDLARTRRETYPQPGALPEVEAAPLAEDLQRRDFTIHAMALPLLPGPAELIDPHGGQLDLQLQLLRGLHPRTFADDPTRLLRAARYAANLSFQVEPQTLACLTTAVRDRVLDTVTGERIWGELQRTLLSPEVAAAAELLLQWGVCQALGIEPAASLPLLPDLAPASREMAPASAPDQRALAALALLAGDNHARLGERLALSKPQRQALAAAVAARRPPPPLFASDPKNSTLYQALRGLPPAARMALWVLHPKLRDRLRRASQLLSTRADISGADLRAAGYPPGPNFRAALQSALDAKLDHGADRRRQLQAAREVLERKSPRPPNP